MEEIVENREEINKKMDEVERFTTSPVGPKPQTKTVSLEPVLEQLHKYLKDEKRNIIGVSGQRGVGKTTLLNALNNDLMNHRGGCHVVIAINVSNSDTLDVVRIQRKFTEQLNLPWINTDEKSRARYLSRALSKKQFVILLDDVAREFPLEDVGIPFPDNGSKIVVASRDEYVCNQMGAQQNLIRMETLDKAALQELLRSNFNTDAYNAIYTDPTMISCVNRLSWLQYLTISECTPLERLPDSIGSLENLRPLNLCATKHPDTLDDCLKFLKGGSKTRRRVIRIKKRR